MTFVINRPPIRTGQEVQVFHYGREWCDVDFTIIVPKSDTGQTAPLRAGAQAVQQFDERDFAVEAHDGIEAGNAPEDFRGLEAGVVPAHREMRGYSGRAQRFNDLAKVGGHVLKDQREADHVRLIVTNALKNFVGIRTISHDGRLVARGVHGRHQVTQSEIVLVLKTDQQDLLWAACWLAYGYLHRQGWQISHH